MCRSSFDYPNNVWCTIQIMKLVIILFCSCYSNFMFPSSKYSSKHPVLKHPQCMFFH